MWAVCIRNPSLHVYLQTVVPSVPSDLDPVYLGLLFLFCFSLFFRGAYINPEMPWSDSVDHFLFTRREVNATTPYFFVTVTASRQLFFAKHGEITWRKILSHKMPQKNDFSHVAMLTSAFFRLHFVWRALVVKSIVEGNSADHKSNFKCRVTSKLQYLDMTTGIAPHCRGACVFCSWCALFVRVCLVLRQFLTDGI